MLLSEIPFIQYRKDISKVLIEKNIDGLESFALDILKLFNDVNDLVDTCSDLFCAIADKHLPLGQHHAKRK